MEGTDRYAIPCFQPLTQRDARSHPRGQLRAGRGPLWRLGPISDYQLCELQAMVRWVQSDGKLRTDEEILSEVVRELGFLRRGTRIVEAVNQAIRSVRAAAGTR